MVRSNINQNRIEGNYSIVSVFHTDYTWAANELRHRNVVNMLILKGFRVQELNGKWAGVEELSIRIEGIGARTIACTIARDYAQQAYIVVSGGIADIIDTRTNSTESSFTRMVETTDNDNYSEAQGFRFTFA